MAEKKSKSRPQRLGVFQWKDKSGGRLWELTDGAGAHVAEISAESDRLWAWTVIVPAWYRVNGNPQGKVKSLDDAKAVCETILLGTILEG